MIVLRAIGAFFVRIWRWIKETAWVQPLLIVGIIFGIIFSIPSIVNGIKGLNEKMASSETYYRQFQYSLVGGEKSEADKVTEYIYKKYKGEDVSEYKQYETKLGQKFFLVFVSEDCSSCKEAKGGFQSFKDNFNGSFNPNDGTQFNMVTIFTDEVTSETTTKETAFVQYMNRHDQFFEYAAGVGYETDYYRNGKVQKSDLEVVEQVDPKNFLTPTVMFIDFTDKAVEYVGDVGVREIFFNIAGESDYKKAELLLDCWKHTGDFSINNEK